MQIRIEGREDEMDRAVRKIQAAFSVKSVSKFYRNRTKTGKSEYGRIYITVADDGQAC